MAEVVRRRPRSVETARADIDGTSQRMLRCLVEGRESPDDTKDPVGDRDIDSFSVWERGPGHYADDADPPYRFLHRADREEGLQDRRRCERGSPNGLESRRDAALRGERSLRSEGHRL